MEWEWWLIGILAVVVFNLIAVYRVSLRENRALGYYAIVLLVHDGLREDHREKLAQYVASVDAKGGYDLGLKVRMAMVKMAFQFDTRAVAAGLLWDLKTGSQRVPRGPS